MADAAVHGGRTGLPREGSCHATRRQLLHPSGAARGGHDRGQRNAVVL